VVVPMFVIVKLLRLLVLMFGIVSATFLIMHYGFDRSHADTVLKYTDFLKRLLHLDFGISTVTGQPILTEIMSRWPATLELGMIAMLISLVIGMPLGIIAAINQKKLLDRFLIGLSLIGYSMPAFWFALTLILFFSIGLDLTPVSGRIDISYDLTSITGFMIIDTLLQPASKGYHLNPFYSALSHLILPSIVLASVPTAVFARLTRSSLLEILPKDFILGARARGLSEYRVILIHGLRNALTPILSVGGIHFITTVAMGSIVVEVVFGWPGIGSYIIQSVYARDFGVVQIFLLAMAIIVLLTNTFIDLIIHLINPRA